MNHWNEYSPERIERLLDWINTMGPDRKAILILPGSVDPWLCVGDVANALDWDRPSSGSSVSSTCGAEEYALDNTRVYVYTLPEAS